MKNRFRKSQNRTLASKPVNNVLLDFLLSRQAMMCTEKTIEYYRYNLGKILDWMQEHGVKSPEEIQSRHVRALLSDMADRGCSDAYMNLYARVIKTFTRFMVEEGYIDQPVKIQMPKVAQKHLRVYSSIEIKQILLSCKDHRERAFILAMVDTGLRNAEVRALNWSDLEISTGLIRVNCGKGRKSRSVMVGINTRRMLLKYHSQISASESSPLFQTESGGRFTEPGLRSWMARLSQRAKIHITPHALRRTCATLSLRAGMNVFQLQGLLGHSTLEMTRRYVTMIEDDLVDAHQKHGPIDNFVF